MKQYTNRQWIACFFIIAIVFMGGIAFFNYSVDSVGLFNNFNYLSVAAKQLASGKMIAGVENYDERLFQKLIIKNIDRKIDCIALGSSRTMQLRKRFFLEENTEYMNHSVSGAMLQECIAIIGAYKNIKNYFPQTIIIGVEPWFFNKNAERNRWESLKDHYHFMLREMKMPIPSGKESKVNKWKQLINYDYSIANFRFLYERLTSQKKLFYVTETIEIDDRIKEIDGSMQYPYKIRYIKPEKVRIKAKNYTKKPAFLKDFDKISNKEMFENLVDYLQGEGVNLVFYLPPYNPITYDFFMQDPIYKNLHEVEVYINDIAKSKNIPVYGSYNPHKFKFTNDDFIDAIHGRDTVIQDIFAEYKKQKPSGKKHENRQ